MAPATGDQLSLTLPSPALAVSPFVAVGRLAGTASVEADCSVTLVEVPIAGYALATNWTNCVWNQLPAIGAFGKAPVNVPSGVV